VSSDCKSFRSALEAELLGRPSQEKLAWLSWHAHLLACGSCRELLAREEALEALLASLPEPKLPAALTRRVLLRLREDRAVEVRLDSLLDLGLSGATEPPRGLAAEILARLAPEREAEAARSLDALLDRARDVAVPSGLAARVLAGVAAERVRAARTVRRTWIYAAAAGLLVLLLGRFVWVWNHTARPSETEFVAQDEAAPDPQMLAALDVLEQWDLLMQDDVDVLLSTLGPADVALLDYR
jgi:hypothetical protein